MFKPLIAACFGLSAMATVATADMLNIPSAPHPPMASLIGSNGLSLTRMAEMCAGFGFDCIGIGAIQGPHPYVSAEGQADAEKRHALLLAEQQERLAEQGLRSGLPRIFGWNAMPFALPNSQTGTSRPDPGSVFSRSLDQQIGNAFAAPGTQGIWDNAFRSLRRPVATQRLYPRVGPHAVPQMRPRALFNDLSNLHPRTLPHGGPIPWPTY